MNALFFRRLYEKSSEHDQAAAAYTEYVNETPSTEVSCRLVHCPYVQG